MSQFGQKASLMCVKIFGDTLNAIHLPYNLLNLFLQDFFQSPGLVSLGQQLTEDFTQTRTTTVE